MEELTTHANVDSWIPADSYVDTIIEASVCHSQLSGIISMVNYNMQACDGDIIQVRHVRARTAQGSIGEYPNDCLSATSSTIGTSSVQIKKYGDYDQITGFAEFETCGSLRTNILNEMSKGLAKKFDELVYEQIATCGSNAPNTTYTTKGAWQANPAIVGSCCTFGFDLYNNIVLAINHMRGDALNPTHIIMHPDVSAYLYFKEAGVMPNLMSTVKYSPDGGSISSIMGVDVIECCNANNGASGATICIVIDKSRAVAEAWGRRPTFSRVYEPECDYTKEVLWAYYGAGRITATATAGVMEGVVHIVSA